MSIMKKVSVIVPCYNMGRYIRQALLSIVEQDYLRKEIIIINDGSTDNSEVVIKEFALEQSQDIEIKYICQNNCGLACARNIALSHSDGDYIALLDPDDVWYPNRLSVGVKCLDENPDVSLVHSNITYIDEDSRATGVPVRDKKYLSGFIFEYLLVRDAHISCPTVLVRRNCFSAVGGFDEQLTYLGCEDRDMWLRITAKEKVLYVDQELAFYRKVSGSMSSNVDKMFKAKMYVAKKHVASGVSFKLRRKAYSSVYIDTAQALYSNQHFAGSIENYLQALKLWPFNIAIFKYMVKSFVKGCSNNWQIK